MPRLVGKKEFSLEAGVDPAAITRACKAALAPAVVGKRIDADHPAAVAYREKQKAKPPRTSESGVAGMDPMYHIAVDFCQNSGRWSQRGISDGAGVSRSRAKSMLAMMHASGIVPEDEEPLTPTPKPATKQTPAPKPKPRLNLKAPPPEAVDPFEGIPEDIREFVDKPLRELVVMFGTATGFKDFLDAVKKIEDIQEKRIKNAKMEGDLIARDLVEKGVLGHVEGCHLKLLTDASKTISKRAVNMVKAGDGEKEIEALVKDQLGAYIRPMKAKIARALSDE